ncbi:hypothetical protein AHF37_00017 [Paragonimus kellicotti]|nr:hypothetical protein AHF37_00017 [Paragonimus kellicotti]
MSVSVVGFDVGCSTSYIAVAKGGGIETITNEYSDRQTPTCVAFTDRRRLIGTSAKLQHVTNINNTFVNFLPLVGKKVSDPAVERERRFLPYRVDEGPDGRVAMKVKYNGATHVFTPEQVLAMHLTKLRDITETALSNKVVDVVINVPTYYTDAERRALLDASRIAGLNCVKLVNDLTAVGTAYGLYNMDLPSVEQPPKIVAFVSVGYVSTQVAICAFNSGKMKVLVTTCDWQLGGRDFDEVIFHKLAEVFEEKYGIKIIDYPRATVRLLQECEKVKKAMSANSQELPVNIECLSHEKDLVSRMKRSDFEEWSSELLMRFEKVLLRSLSLAKLTPNDVNTVELVGGTSRIPALKSIVLSVFKQEGRTTLNADEAVARGCALQAAICSPAYKVRDFNVTEVCPYAITLYWDREDSGDQATPVTTENDEVTVEGKETSIEIFPFLHPIPSSRRLFFNRRGPFTLEARYSHMDELPNQNNVIGIFKIANIPSKTGEVRKIRVKVRVNSHGIFAVSQAEVAEEYEKEVEMEVPEATPKVVAENGKDPNLVKAMDVETPSNGDVSMDAAPNNNATAAEQQMNTVPASDKKTTPKKTLVKKKAVRYKDLTVDASIMQFSVKQLNEFCEIEGKLSEQDELEHRRTHAKNSVEEYVYEMRNKLRDTLNKFATPSEHTNLLKALDDTEDWLYGEGEDLHRQAYADRLDQIRTLGNSIELRAKEQTDRASAVKRFEQSVVHIRKVLDSVAANQETYNHLTPEQLTQLQTSLTQYETWLREQLRAQDSRPLTEDPVLKTADIMSKMQAMEAVCHPIINTPKPVVPPPPTQPAATIEVNNNSNENCPVDENVTKKGKPIKAGKVQNKSENMDVD